MRVGFEDVKQKYQKVRRRDNPFRQPHCAVADWNPIMNYNDSFCAVVVFLLLQRKENFLCIHYPFNCISISKSAGPKPRPSPQLLLQWKRRFLCKRMCSSATCPKLMKTAWYGVSYVSCCRPSAEVLELAVCNVFLTVLQGTLRFSVVGACHDILFTCTFSTDSEVASD